MFTQNISYEFSWNRKVENNYCIMFVLPHILLSPFLPFFPFLPFHSSTQTNMGLNNWKCLYARNILCVWESAYEYLLLVKRTRIWVRCNPTKRWQEVNLKYHFVHICCIISHCWTNHHKKEDYKILTEMWNNVIHFLCK